MLQLLINVVIYAGVGWALSRIAWSLWLSNFVYYFIGRPYMSDSVNRPINVVECVVLIYAIARCTYNRYYHPLCRFKGPLLNSVSRLPWSVATFRGWQVQRTHQWHLKHGPIVRIAPDELSFIDPQAITDIYARRGPRYPIPKDPIRNNLAPNGVHPLPTAGDDDHRRMRKQMNMAFSDRAIAEQEPLVRQHADTFIDAIHGESRTAGAAGVDIGQWFSFAIFDIIGELGFNGSFETLTKEDNREWVAMLLSFPKGNIQAFSITKLSKFLKPLLYFLISKETVQNSKDYWVMSRARIHQRMDTEPSRPDIMTRVLKYKPDSDEHAMSVGEIEGTGWILIFAGAETTASLLTAAVSFLVKRPPKMRKLAQEVRSTFGSASEIKFRSSAHLPYLDAVIHESFRLAPPFAGPAFREVDDEVHVICGEPIPKKTTVGVPQFAAGRSPQHFRYADAFLPERWLEETSPLLIHDSTDPFFLPNSFQSDERDVVQPFSIGPRNCIGQALAWAEMRLFLALLVWTYDIESAGKQPVDWETQKAWNQFDRVPFGVSLKRREEASG